MVFHGDRNICIHKLLTYTVGFEKFGSLKELSPLPNPVGGWSASFVQIALNSKLMFT